MIDGNKSGKFGSYEFIKSLNWTRLAIILAMAVLGWVSTDVIPPLEGQGGVAATVSGLLAYIVNAVLLALKDNSGKQL